MDITDEYNKTGYPIPKTKEDEQEKQFDYWDMIAFARMCVDEQLKRLNFTLSLSEKDADVFFNAITKGEQIDDTKRSN